MPRTTKVNRLICILGIFLSGRGSRLLCVRVVSVADPKPGVADLETILHPSAISTSMNLCFLISGTGDDVMAVHEQGEGMEQ